MTDELKTFINENMDLINQDTKESWEEVYKKLDNFTKGELTQVMLEAKIDPAKVLGYIPTYYLENSNIKEYVIHDNVTYIGKWAFYSCILLTSVTIPDSVTTISRGAFQNCRNLTSIEIPDSVTSSIGQGTFIECRSLTSVIIGDNVTSIDSYAFVHCISLTNVTIPNHVTSIGIGAFKNCDSLKSIEIPSSVTSIGKEAFRDCKSLTRIEYNGTKEQWENIFKDAEWNVGSIATKIICTDGVIEL